MQIHSKWFKTSQQRQYSAWYQFFSMFGVWPVEGHIFFFVVLAMQFVVGRFCLAFTRKRLIFAWSFDLYEWMDYRCDKTCILSTKIRLVRAATSLRSLWTCEVQRWNIKCCLRKNPQVLRFFLLCNPVNSNVRNICLGKDIVFFNTSKANWAGTKKSTIGIDGRGAKDPKFPEPKNCLIPSVSARPRTCRGEQNAPFHSILQWASG